MTQLVDRPLPIPEVWGSNPVIGKNLCIEHLFTVNCIEKTKIKEKEAVNGTIFFKNIQATFLTFLHHVSTEEVVVAILKIVLIKWNWAKLTRKEEIDPNVYFFKQLSDMCGILGGIPGLVVMGGDSFSRGHVFESQHSILDGHLVASFCCIICIACLKRPQINEKAVRAGAFKKHD